MNKILRDKRGLTIGDMYPIVLTIVLVVMVLGVGAFVVSKVKEKQELTSSENFTMIYGTTYSLAYLNQSGDLDTYKAYNYTGGVRREEIARGNFTLSTTAGTVALATTTYNNTNIQHNYAYGTVSATFKQGLTGLGDLASWIPTITLIIVAAIILGLVIRSFAAKKVE